jgi:hypothetical protein
MDPNFPGQASYQAKAAESRMGSGKGNPEYWVAVVKPGRVLFEMNGVTEELLKKLCVLPVINCRSKQDSFPKLNWMPKSPHRENGVGGEA